MKVTFFGDTHGNIDWENSIYELLLESDKVVFLGDYVDSFHKIYRDQIDNLKTLIEYKKKYPNKISLLLGNHDVAYIYGFSRISGYSDIFENEIKDIFDKNYELFDLAWGYMNSNKEYTLATHAGLTENFLHKCVNTRDKELNIKKELERDDIPSLLNEYVKHKKDLLWEVGRNRGGISRRPSIIWCDINEFFEDRCENINQIFGHTPLHSPLIKKEDDEFQTSLLVCLDNYKNLKTFFSTLYL